MYVLRPMQLRDLTQVMRVNRRCFSSPWSERIFRVELTDNPNSYWVVLEGEQPRREQKRSIWSVLTSNQAPRYNIIGFGGFWLLSGEAHISNIGIDTDYRGQGLGELLLISMLKKAIHLQAQWTSLEVRVSNLTAINLYEKYHFRTAGTKYGYYHDNQEDAHWMVVKPLNQKYDNLIDHFSALLRQRIQWTDYFAQEDS